MANFDQYLDGDHGPRSPARHVDGIVAGIDEVLEASPDVLLLDSYERVLAHEVRDRTLSHEEADMFMRAFIHNNFGGAIQLQLTQPA